MITDLTQGKPFGILLRFSLPMLLSVAFQQMYNIADSVIAGQFIGVNALAAIGASYPVTMIFMAFAVGANVGCSVVISQLFGKKDLVKMKTAINTSYLAVLLLALVMTLLGTVFCSDIIALLNTPANIFDDSALYLRIYTFGLVFLFMYNICTGIFTALGDSKTPLYFLIASSLGNIALDLLAVCVLGMGIMGVALATFVAQGIASVFAFVTLFRRIRKIKTEEKSAAFSGECLKMISRIAIPSILQQSFVSVGNLFIQSLINSYGSAVIAGYSAAIKLNTFSINSIVTTANGYSSFAAQNIGAEKYDRVTKGLKSALLIGLFCAVFFSALLVVFKQPLVLLFMDSSALSQGAVSVVPQYDLLFRYISYTGALSTGCDFLMIVSPFYSLVMVKLVCDGLLRGAGAVRCFATTTFADLIIRVLLAFILTPFLGVSGIWWSWPLGWVLGTALSAFFVKAGYWRRER